MLKKIYFTLFNLIFLFVYAQNDYTYDASGNLKSDANKGITNIEYAYCNIERNIAYHNYLPSKIEFDSGNRIEYIYQADCTKLQKNIFKEGKLIKTVDYIDGYVYVNGKLKYKNHNEGFIKYGLDENGNQTITYVYHFLDHQNNVRLLYADLNSDGKVDQAEILAEYNYYPFGLRHEGYNNVEHELLASSEYKKGYQQQELDDDLGLGWYGFKYRNYDPAIARFTTVDPLAEEYAYNSPYNFQENKLGMGVELEGLEMVPNMSAQHDIYQQLKTSSSAQDAQARVNQMNRATGVMAGTALDFAPIAGDIKGVTEGMIGQDLATGGVLSPFERVVSLAGLSELRGIKKVSDAVDLVTDVSKNVDKGKDGARFIGDTDGKLIDSQSTPKGSYVQPDGSRTDVLQQRSHFDKKTQSNHGTSHTHEVYENKRPDGSIDKGPSRSKTHTPTYQEVKNIEDGTAKRTK